MDPARHFSEYRACLKSESLDWCVEYSKQKQTKRPEVYPTAYDYLSSTMAAVRQAVAAGDDEGYRRHVALHQEAMILLFEAMVEEDLWNYQDVKVESLTRLIEERGWQWFKFCKRSLKYRLDIEGEKVDIVFVPRYAEKYRDLWSQKGKLVFDANEIGLLFRGVKPGKVLMAMILKAKRAGVVKVLKAGGEGDQAEMVCKPVGRLNQEGAVDDWALPLW